MVYRADSRHRVNPRTASKRRVQLESRLARKKKFYRRPQMSDEAGVSDICESCGCFARIYDKGLCEECYECEVEKINNRVSDIGSEYDSDDEAHDFYNESIMRTQSSETPQATPAIGSYKCTIDGLECPICLDKVKQGEDVASLPCAHTFHHSCISLWLTRHNQCPVCRTAAFD